MANAVHFDFQQWFGANPGLYLVLDTELTIIDASQQYLEATLTFRDEILGQRMFEVFPDNPNDQASSGSAKISASLARSLSTGQTDCVPLLRYDIRDWVSRAGNWVEKYWLPVNRPVFARGGSEVTHLIHQVEDATELMHLRTWLDDQLRVNREQSNTLLRMQTDVAARNRSLHEARGRLRSALHGGEGLNGAKAQLAQLGAAEARGYFSPGEPAPHDALYFVHHRRACPAPSRVFVPAGKEFAACPRCKLSTRYRIDRVL